MHEVDAFGHRDARGGGHRDLLGQSAEAGRREDPVAGRDPFHPFADIPDDAGHFGSRREGQRRLELVAVLDHQHVGEVDGAGVDIDHDLAGGRLRIFDLLEHQRLGRAELLAQDGFHRPRP